MSCSKCKRIVSGDCMLNTGVCVFCHYGIHDWDSNGRLVTEREATNFYEYCHKTKETWVVIDGKRYKQRKRE